MPLTTQSAVIGIVALLAGAVIGFLAAGLLEPVAVVSPPTTPPGTVGAASNRPVPDRAPEPGAPDKAGDTDDVPIPVVDIVPSGLPDGAQPDLTEVLPEWPDDLPAELQPEAIASRIEGVARSCWGDAFMGVDCSSPPCFAVVDVIEGEAPDPFACDAWQEEFPGGISRGTDRGMCPDGSVVTTSLFAPGLAGMPVPPKDPDDRWRGTRHMLTRARRHQMDSGCTAPPELQVRNRPGFELQWVKASD